MMGEIGNEERGGGRGSDINTFCSFFGECSYLCEHADNLPIGRTYWTLFFTVRVKGLAKDM